ncbi:hypothetical protein [Haloarcula litorea]|uniref:hypothetical protein n=1 Tax=Haloarcula litorea TaxID=3032579 RepID=UPI0023E84628|nr:hypothetical protein [Halomicroarcula sp. GDY20]
MDGQRLGAVGMAGVAVGNALLAVGNLLRASGTALVASSAVAGLFAAAVAALWWRRGGEFDLQSDALRERLPVLVLGCGAVVLVVGAGTLALAVG